MYPYDPFYRHYYPHHRRRDRYCDWYDNDCYPYRDHHYWRRDRYYDRW